MVTRERESELDTSKLAELIIENHLIGLGVPFMLQEFGPLPTKRIKEELAGAKVTISPKTLQNRLQSLVDAGAIEVKKGIYSLTNEMDEALTILSQ